jgi:polygalacturonase
MNNRREFIKGFLIISGAAASGLWRDSSTDGVLAHALRSVSITDSAWAQVPEILKRIKPPVFLKRDFQVTRYGAVGDGKTDCTSSFAKAIDACNQAGGGRVVVPAGDFLTGPIHLKSNVNLHVSSGGTIRFSQDPRKYLPLVFSRWEGMELMNYSPFIYAFEQKNIAITGPGVFDGQSNNQAWWPWNGRTQYGCKEGEPNQRKARAALSEMAERGVPVAERLFGEGHYLRPQFIQPRGRRSESQGHGWCGRAGRQSLSQWKL